MKLIRVYPPTKEQWKAILMLAGMFLAAQVASVLLVNLIYYLRG